MNKSAYKPVESPILLMSYYEWERVHARRQAKRKALIKQAIVQKVKEKIASLSILLFAVVTFPLIPELAVILLIAGFFSLFNRWNIEED